MVEMKLDKGVAITFLGHACFELVSPAGEHILIDPWLKDNPQAPPGAEARDKLDFILASHAHMDHLGDTLDLAKESGAAVIAMPEISRYLMKKGLSQEQAIGMNKGGSFMAGSFQVTMVHAIHSSSLVEGDEIVYGGEAVGFVLRFQNGFSVYYAGDTGVFYDMNIIADLYKPDLAILPIGSHYVMGPEEAVYACELLQPRYVIPMHFGTFPALTGTPERFQELMQRLPEVAVLVMKPGETIG
jgi:L-ascorbate metabolism protein UlaG (beta-lactamase superfamily)